LTRRPLLLVPIAVVAAAAPAAHAAEIVGYDGETPFNCELQQAGTGTAIPNPDADPLCVEYDKTNQSVLPGLGLVEFLSGEPARFAYAGDKCFYYQRDHWRGAVDQDDEQTETYNWDGGYFIDRGRGVGGAAAANFTLGNASADPSAFPGFPEAWKPYFGYGRGGVQLIDSMPIDPACAEKAEREDVYRRPGTASAAPPPPREDAAPSARPRLRLAATWRRCSVRVRLVGADRRRVRRVDLRARGRVVRRDARAPFALRVSARRARSVRAVGILDDGTRVALRIPGRRARCTR
jgi:hypothetical protein